jgi:hypothetical protein
VMAKGRLGGGEQWRPFGHPTQQGFGGFNMNNGLYPLFVQGGSDNFQGAYGHQGPPHHLPQGPNGFNHNALGSCRL